MSTQDERAAKALLQDFLALPEYDRRVMLSSFGYGRWAKDPDLNFEHAAQVLVENNDIYELERKLRRKRRWATLRKWLKWLLILVVVLALLFWGIKSCSGPSTAEEPIQEASASASPTADADDPFAQHPRGHAYGRVNDTYKEELAQAAKLANNNGVVDAEIAREVHLKSVREDMQALAIYATAVGLWHDYNDYKSLLSPDGTTASEEGRALYYKYEGRIMAAKAERADAPADGTNSGIDQKTDQFGVHPTPGVTDDRSATKYTLPNSEVVWVMDRCGNIVFPSGKVPKSLPKVKTDEQLRPTPKPTPTPSLQQKQPKQDPVQRGNAVTGGGKNRASNGAGTAQPRPANPPAVYTPPAQPKPKVVTQGSSSSSSTTKKNIPAGTSGGGPQSSTTVNDGGSNDKGGGGTTVGGDAPGSGSNGNGTATTIH